MNFVLGFHGIFEFQEKIYYVVFLSPFLLLKMLHQCTTAYWNVENGEIILWDSVDISIAVATEKV